MVSVELSLYHCRIELSRDSVVIRCVWLTMTEPVSDSTHQVNSPIKELHYDPDGGYLHVWRRHRVMESCEDNEWQIDVFAS